MISYRVALPLLAAMALAAPAALAEEWTRGEVRKIDAAAARITLKHDYIKIIDMPPMAMVFPVADPGLLDGLKVGDAIRFVLEVPGGKMVVTKIEPAGKPQ